MEILISNRQDEFLDKELVEELSTFALKKEKVSNEAELSISFVTPEEMTQLNERYRNISKPADVLSFTYHDSPDELLGDIIICPVEVREKAKEQEMTFDEYFALLIVHGILHLLGYNHEKKDEAKIMFTKEDRILKAFHLSGRTFQ